MRVGVKMDNIDKLGNAQSPWYKLGLAYNKDRLDNLMDCRSDEDVAEYNRGYVDGQTDRIRDMATAFFAELDEVCKRYPRTFIFRDGAVVYRLWDGGFEVQTLVK